VDKDASRCRRRFATRRRRRPGWRIAQSGRQTTRAAAGKGLLGEDDGRAGRPRANRPRRRARRRSWQGRPLRPRPRPRLFSCLCSSESTSPPPFSSTCLLLLPFLFHLVVDLLLVPLVVIRLLLIRLLFLLPAVRTRSCSKRSSRCRFSPGADSSGRPSSTIGGKEKKGRMVEGAARTGDGHRPRVLLAPREGTRYASTNTRCPFLTRADWGNERH
jgi:hypothetical protein